MFNRDNYWLMLSVAVFALLALLFPPAFYTSIDEHNYIRSAWLLSENFAQPLSETLVHNEGKSLAGFYNGETGHVSKYNLGTSLLYLPLAFLISPGIYSYWLVNTVFTIITILAISAVSKDLKVPRWTISLFLLYPTLLYFSRTAFSEVSTMLLLSISALLLVKLLASSTYRAGLIWAVSLGGSLGLLVLTRYNYAIWAVIVLVTLVYFWVKGKYSSKSAAIYLLALGLAGLPFLAALLYINSNLYGCITCTGYSLSGEESFDLALIPGRIFHYLLYLSPVLIFSGFAKHWLKYPVLAMTLILIVTYSAAGGLLFSDNILVNFTYGVRFFLPLYPLLLLLSVLGIVDLISKLNIPKVEDRLASLCKLTLMVAFIASAVIISTVHRQFTLERKHVHSQMQQYIRENHPSGEIVILGPEGDALFWGEHLYADFERMDFYVISDIHAVDRDEGSWGDAAFIYFAHGIVTSSEENYNDAREIAESYAGKENFYYVNLLE